MSSETFLSVRWNYRVASTRDVFATSNRTLVDAITRKEPERCHRILAIVDGGVADATPDCVRRLEAYVQAHCNQLTLVTEPMVLVGGEDVKNDPRFLNAVLRQLHDHHIDRQACVVVIGGGAVLDVVGYAAAITHRGVRLVRLPSTVLAQADSGVGVKNSVNAFGKKNFLGTFAPPFAVVNDSTFLQTLTTRDRVAGMAEAVKVALVRDALFFRWIRRNATALGRGDVSLVDDLVRRSADLHMRHILTGGDPFEMESARPLDFGHWAAHKLEVLTDYRLRHGECVAIGLALDSLYSAAAGFCDLTIARNVVDTLERLGFKLWDEALDMRSSTGELRVLEGLEEFREHLGGELTVTLLAEAGRGIEVHTMDRDWVLASLEQLRTLSSAKTAAPSLEV